MALATVSECSSTVSFWSALATADSGVRVKKACAAATMPALSALFSCLRRLLDLSCSSILASWMHCGLPLAGIVHKCAISCICCS